MKKRLLLRSIVTVLNTSFTVADEVDADALRRHVRVALAAGVAGLLILGMASKVRERKRLASRWRVRQLKSETAI